MLSLLLYYIILPVAAGALVIKFIKRYGRSELPRGLRNLQESRPMESRTYRAAGLALPDGPADWLGDFETLDEAVDAAYKARDSARGPREGPPARFLVLNDQGEIVEEVDA